MGIKPSNTHLAEEQSTGQEQETAKRLEEAEHEAVEARYDLYATKRKEGTEALEETLDLLASQLDALIELDRAQRLEESNLGLAGSDMPYAELLDNHLSIWLAKYIRAVGPFVSQVDMRVQRATLLEKDFRTRTRSEQKAEVETEVERSRERVAQQELLFEEAKRRKAFEERRSQLCSWRGDYQANLLASQRQAIDREVYAQLEKEYPELCEAERLAKLEHEREKVRSTLLGPGEDYESLPEERRAEVDAAVEEWVTDGEALRPA